MEINSHRTNNDVVFFERYQAALCILVWFGIKKLTGLSNLNALYLTENEVDKLFKNFIDFI